MTFDIEICFKANVALYFILSALSDTDVIFPYVFVNFLQVIFTSLVSMVFMCVCASRPCKMQSWVVTGVQLVLSQPVRTVRSLVMTTGCRWTTCRRTSWLVWSRHETASCAYLQLFQRSETWTTSGSKQIPAVMESSTHGNTSLCQL